MPTSIAGRRTWCEKDRFSNLRDIADRLADCCRRVDPLSTDKALEEAEQEEF